MRRRILWTGLLGLALAAACRSSDDTAIVVEVWSDLETPEHIDTLVVSLDTTMVGNYYKLSEGSAATGPRIIERVSLVPSSASARTRVIEAAGYKGDTRRVAQSARLTFVTGERRILTLYLGRDCLGHEGCGTGQTCRGGACQPDDVIPGQYRKPGEALPGDFFPTAMPGTDGGAGSRDGPSRPPGEDARPGPATDGGSPTDAAAPPTDGARPVNDSAGAIPDAPGIPPDTGITCPPGQAVCRDQCISATGCCDDGDCPSPPNGRATCGPDHTCRTTCVGPYHLCGTACASNTDTRTCGTSCMPCPIPGGGGSATCDGMMCGAMCPPNTKICLDRCIDAGAPCMGMCPNGQHPCGQLCARNDDVNSCGTTRCTPCPTPPPNATATCANGVCGHACNSGYKPCAGACIRNENCCLPSDCTAPPNANATCTNQVCGFTCTGGYMRCGNSCSPSVVEDCYNGVDDDCDNAVDCGDSDCAGPAVCTAAGTLTPGIQVAANAACPTDYGPATNLFANLMRPTETSCTGCNCDATGRVTCNMSLSRYLNLSCSGLAILETTLSGTNCFTYNGNASSWRYGSPTPTPSCAAANGTPSLPAPTWGASSRFCPATPRGGGCGAGRACIPRPPAANKLCTLATGSAACPTGYTAMSTWYGGYTGTQSCSCSCTNPTGAHCSFVRLNVWANPNGCMGVPSAQITTFPNMTCMDLREFRMIGSPLPPTCQLTRTIMSTIAEQNQMTLCCMP